jgi:hypothetical protein
MIAPKTRVTIAAAILAAMVFLAVLAWRGVIAMGESELSPATIWREADEADLF